MSEMICIDIVELHGDFVYLFVSVLSLSLTQSLVLAAPRSFRFVPLAALY